MLAASRRTAVVVGVALCLLAVGCGDTSISTSAQPNNAQPTAPTAPATPECLAIGDRKLPPVSLHLDPLEEAAKNRLADLPITLPAARRIAFINPYANAGEYIASTKLIADPKARLAAMERDGFSGGVNVAFQSGMDNYGAIILRFRDAAGALDYFRVHLKDACTLAVQSAPLADLPGISYLRSDGQAKAVFVQGNAEIALDICTCAEVQDRVALAASWATVVQHQLSGAK